MGSYIVEGWEEWWEFDSNWYVYGVFDGLDDFDVVVFDFFGWLFKVIGYYVDVVFDVCCVGVFYLFGGVDLVVVCGFVEGCNDGDVNGIGVGF